MIYTLTCSPSLDAKVTVDKLNTGKINISSLDFLVPGGKGINISTLLAKHGITTTAFGFLGGSTGKYFLDNLHPRIIKDFIDVNDKTRVNIKIINGQETQINANGPKIDKEERDILFSKLHSLRPQMDLLIISGAAPINASEDFYAKCVSKINGTPFIIDARGKYLLETLKYQPELVKPNKEELEEIVNKKLKTIEDIEIAAKKLLKKGAKRVLVSLGEEGLLFINNRTKIFRKAKKGKVKTTIGAGDALIAGFVEEYINNSDDRKCVGAALTMANNVVFKDYLL